MKLGGKVAIVTGAARGIGLACASRFAVEGAKVILADIEEDEGARAAEQLQDAGHECRFVACDVGERLDVRNLINATVDAHGGVDILLSNAGIILGGDFLEITEEEFDQVLRVNLKGTFLAGQAVARRMVEQIEAGGPPGTIINMSSINAVFALPSQVPYTVSKGGVSQLTKAMALALARYGIRVNAIGPGSINTDMLGAVFDDEGARRRILSRTPLGRIGEPDDVAGVAAFLASDDAGYVSGQTVYVDGGRLPLNLTVDVAD